MTRFGRFPDRGVGDLAQEAARAAIADAGITAKDVQLISFSNALSGLITGQESIRSQVAFGRTEFGALPMINVENACASGATALHVAFLGIAAGSYDVVLVVGSERLTHSDKQRTFAALSAAIELDHQAELEASVESDGKSGGAFMMDIYADITRRYMDQSGATVQDIADVSVKNRFHASLNPKAQYASPVTRDEVLASRAISGPITLLMCSPIGDGAAALVLCSEEFAKKIGADSVRVRGTAIETAVPGGTPQTPAQRAADRAYEMAGLGPENIDIVELHDATAPAELIHLEELRLCRPGEGPRLMASGATRLGGRMPVNTSGGLIGRGHPVGASGVAKLVEITEQLRGRNGARQAMGVRVGISEDQGGYLHPDPAVAAVTILSRD
jgi:acetyl-CoA acetyltransferase